MSTGGDLLNHSSKFKSLRGAPLPPTFHVDVKIP